MPRKRRIIGQKVKFRKLTKEEINSIKESFNKDFNSMDDALNRYGLTLDFTAHEILKDLMDENIDFGEKRKRLEMILKLRNAFPKDSLSIENNINWSWAEKDE